MSRVHEQIHNARAGGAPAGFINAIGAQVRWVALGGFGRGIVFHDGEDVRHLPLRGFPKALRHRRALVRALSRGLG